MPDHKRPSRGVEPSDIEAVQKAFRHVRDDEGLLGTDEIENRQGREDARAVRQLLVDEAIGHLGVRQDLIDLQVQNGLDPGELYDLRPDRPWTPGR